MNSTQYPSGAAEKNKGEDPLMTSLLYADELNMDTEISVGSAAARERQAFLLGWSINTLGGVNQVVQNLIREFSESGELAPLVIETLDGEPEEHTLDIPLIRIALPSPYDKRDPWKALLAFCLFAPKILWQLHSICLRYRIRVLNPHFVGLEYFILMLLRRLRLFHGKLILSFHGSDLRGMIQSKGLERFFSRWLLRGADALVPCSEGLAQEILMLVPECAESIHPVMNGIDIEKTLRSSAWDRPLPKSFERRTKLLSIGAFEYKKGHDVLLHAFARLRQSHQNPCLIIAGQTRDLLDATRKLVKELKLEQDVLLLHDLPHNEVLALLRASDIFVLSSRWQKGVCGEGFAMALLEAAALGKPVVSTRSCGVSELVADGESGLVVDTDNPELLSEAIAKLLGSPTDAARLGRNLHQTVAGKFTWTAAHAQYLELAHQPADFPERHFSSSALAR